MQVRSVMTTTVDAIETPDSIAYAARRMTQCDVGCLPVLRDGKPVGIVTDRDIVVRAIATGIHPDVEIVRIMSEDVATCSPEDDVETVLAFMSREQVRRLPVCDEGGQLVGIVSLVDMAEKCPDKTKLASALVDICEPGTRQAVRRPSGRKFAAR